MNTPNYLDIVDHIMNRMSEIMRQRTDLDVESARLVQLLHATINMLPDNEKGPILQKWHDVFEVQLNQEMSLSDSIRKILHDAPREWMTVKSVRDRLLSLGFDFSGYMSNPLASVSATLVRLKDKKEVETTTVEGVATYRWKIHRFSREKQKLNTTVGQSEFVLPKRFIQSAMKAAKEQMDKNK